MRPTTQRVLCVFAAVSMCAVRHVSREWTRRTTAASTSAAATETDMLLRNTSPTVTVARNCFSRCESARRRWRWSPHVRNPTGLFALPGRLWYRPPFWWRLHYACFRFQLDVRSVSNSLHKFRQPSSCWTPNCYERCCCCCCWGCCCYLIFKVLKLFHFTTDRR